MRRRITASGDADVATAWQRYAHIRLWREWAPQIRDVDASGDLLRPGLEGTVHGPFGLAVPFHVDTVDPDALTWRWTVRVFGIAVRMTHDLRAREHRRVRTPVGTVAGLTVDGPAPIVLAYGPVARHALGRLCRSTI